MGAGGVLDGGRDEGLNLLNNNDNLNLRTVINRVLLNDNVNDDEFLMNPYNNIDITSLFHDTHSLITEHKNSSKPLFMSVNVQSLNSKHEKLKNFVLSLTNNGIVIDIIALQETWSIKYPHLLSIPGFQPLIFRNRAKGRGGGVGFYIRNGLTCKIMEQLSPFHDKIIETLTVQISYTSNRQTKHFLASSLYRSPSALPGLTHGEQMDNFLTIYEEFLINLSNCNQDSYIFTDSNINLLALENDKHAKDYFTSTLDKGFLITNLKATRIQGDSHSLIDHIITNSKCNSINTGSVIDDLSDHFVVFVQPGLSGAKSKPKSVKKRNFCQVNLDSFKNALSALDWQAVTSLTDVNLSYETFWKMYNDLFELHFPWTSTRFNRNFHKISNFMTKGLLISRKQKLDLQKASISNPTHLNLTYYKNYRNLFNKLIRASKKNIMKKLLMKILKILKKCGKP